ncbi:Helix-turn-helix domain (DUF4817) [Popillia japonica]|uniref:Helix-turn-helix domain (DUF4817) n=1 Tax=Popillia japonica TaxID=7064 RepID=A0AAW1LY26_POPJA
MRKQQENLNVSRVDALFYIIYKILLWEDPILSWAMLGVLHILFWNPLLATRVYKENGAFVDSSISVVTVQFLNVTQSTGGYKILERRHQQLIENLKAVPEV